MAKEADKIEKELDPTQGLLKDSAAMSLLRLEEHVEQVAMYIRELITAISAIDHDIFSDDEPSNDLETVLARVKAVPSRVKDWKKSAARAGADITLSLVCIHCKGVDEKKLKSLEVANRKNAKIDDFMDMFMEAATRIADSIDLDTFVEAVSPPE